VSFVLTLKQKKGVKAMKKVYFFVIIAVLAIAFSLTGPGMARSEPDKFQIGTVFPYTGPFGVYGPTFKQYVNLAVEHWGGKLLGKPIEVGFEDSASTPKTAVEKTIKTIAAGSQFVVGAFSSSSTLAMMPIVERRKVPHLSVLSTHDDITGKKKTRYTFRTSTPQGIENKMTAIYLRKESGAKNLYIVCADYELFREIVADVKKGLEGSGINIMDVQYVPLGTKDFSVLIEKISRTNADTIFLELLGGDLLAFLKQGGPAGLFKNRNIVSTLIRDPMCLGSFPYAISAQNTHRYNYELKVPENEKLVRASWKLWNESPQGPDYYDGITWFMKVIESTGSWDKEKWIDAFEKSSYNGTKGEMVMRPCSHQAAQDGYFGVYKEGEGKDPWGYPEGKCYFQVKKIYKADELYPKCP
jgi:ABC-type branched-subunit amino acid transport system substrate-binding protein